MEAENLLTDIRSRDNSMLAGLKRSAIFFVAFVVLSAGALAADLKVTLVNIGVGDAILIQTPNGKNILIDGGYEAPGRSVLIPYLKSAGVTRIHHMVATHRDVDHVGGLSAVLADSSFTVEQVIYKDTATTNTNRLDNIGARPTLVLSTVTTTALTLDWDPSLTVKVLNAREGQSAVNNNSIVLKLTYGRVSFLLTGDIATPVTEEILTNFPGEFPVTILKVPHHGSNSSISSTFPKGTGAEIGLISCAKDINNNPDDDTLDAYAQAGIPVLRTDRQGHITVRSNGVTYSVDTSLVDAGVSSVSESPSVHAYPNPAPGKTSPQKATIVYEVNGLTDDVRVSVYSLSGERVREWSGAPNVLGRNFLDWDLKDEDGADVADGLYFLQVEASAGGGSQIGRAKMAVLRR
jgi:competence protein ComEC